MAEMLKHNTTLEDLDLLDFFSDKYSEIGNRSMY